jgi:integrase
MRHTHATILVQNGVGAKDVAVRLGHDSVNTTLQTYVHSDLEQQRKVTERFSKIMKGEE